MARGPLKYLVCALRSGLRSVPPSEPNYRTGERNLLLRSEAVKVSQLLMGGVEGESGVHAAHQSLKTPRHCRHDLQGACITQVRVEARNGLRE